MKNFTVATPKSVKLDKKIIHAIVSELKKILPFTIESLQINFVTPDLMIEINKQYLNHNYDTDIITFNYSGSNNNLDGEIFISISQAIDNSIKFNVNLDSELIRLVVHGLLHLIGYDDKNSSEKKIMKSEEDKLTKIISQKFNNILIKYEF